MTAVRNERRVNRESQIEEGEIRSVNDPGPQGIGTHVDLTIFQPF
jgi:hypothetical protein